ncbi:hypothetical protein BDV38DRAFT_280808 [Aspergillus pseudotamarii]|uniref:Uncharacterized protein n=1 Tax=Aspergillus pseudotamarii TaxID=132259 RepID=A0A5N6SYY4_ASPPS|nr:uncharacterized protein BDV38DRAFT_280808 [Aspergillus pseudotamarii]KAE8139896.1 hypothetical protein BDV38DRAFT_280808 [Aspergillus pseudotamarii]
MKTTVFSVCVLAFLSACPGGAVPIDSDTGVSVTRAYNGSAPGYVLDNEDNAGDAGAMAISTDGDETSPWVKRAPADSQWKFVEEKPQGDKTLPSGSSGNAGQELEFIEERPQDPQRPKQWKFIEARPQGDKDLSPAPIPQGDKSPTPGPSGNDEHQFQFVEEKPPGDEKFIPAPSGNDRQRLQFVEERPQDKKDPPPGSSGKGKEKWNVIVAGSQADMDLPPGPSGNTGHQEQFVEERPEEDRPPTPGPGGHDGRFLRSGREPVWRYGTCHRSTNKRFPHGQCVIQMDFPRPMHKSDSLEWKVSCSADHPCGSEGIGACTVDVSDKYHVPHAECT